MRHKSWFWIAKYFVHACKMIAYTQQHFWSAFHAVCVHVKIDAKLYLCWFCNFFSEFKKNHKFAHKTKLIECQCVHSKWPNELYVKNHSIHICTCKPISVRACKCKWSPNWTDCISDWVLSSKRDHFIRMKFHPKKWWQKSEKVLRFTHAIRDWTFFLADMDLLFFRWMPYFVLEWHLMRVSWRAII